MVMTLMVGDDAIDGDVVDIDGGVRCAQTGTHANVWQCGCARPFISA